MEQIKLEVTGLRSLITELRPAALDEIGIEAAIHNLVARVERQGLEVESTIDLDFENRRRTELHAADIEASAYRIVQEAHHGDRRHRAALATHAHAWLRHEDLDCPCWPFNCSS